MVENLTWNIFASAVTIGKTADVSVTPGRRLVGSRLREDGFQTIYHLLQLIAIECQKYYQVLPTRWVFEDVNRVDWFRRNQIGYGFQGRTTSVKFN